MLMDSEAGEGRARGGSTPSSKI